MTIMEKSRKEIAKKHGEPEGNHEKTERKSQGNIEKHHKQIIGNDQKLTEYQREIVRKALSPKKLTFKEPFRQPLKKPFKGTIP